MCSAKTLDDAVNHDEHPIKSFQYWGKLAFNMDEHPSSGCSLLDRETVRQMIKAGDFIQFERFLYQYPELVHFTLGKSYSSTTALLLTLEYAQAEMLDLLLERGADLQQQPRNVLNVFLRRRLDRYTVSNKHNADIILNTLIKQGACFPLDDPKECRDFLTDTLKTCYQEDDVNMMKKLITLGFDPIATEQTANTSILYLSLLHIYKKTLKVCKYLLNLGCSVDSLHPRTSYEQSPLYIAISSAQYDYVQQLLDKGAKTSLLGQHFLHRLTDFYLESPPPDLLKQLTQGMDFNARDEDNNTPLHLAAYRDSKPFIHFFIEQGANKDTQGEYGRTPLLAAISSQSKDAIHELLSLEVDVNLADEKGQTPLDLALSLAGFKRICTALEKAGAKTRIDLAGESNPAERMQAILSSDIEVGEPWADAAQQALSALTPEQLSVWHDLLRHCLDNNSSKPSQRWLKKANTLIDTIGVDEFRQCLLSWLPLLKSKRSKELDYDKLSEQYSYGDQSHFISENNTRLLKGLLWLSVRFADNDMSRELRHVANAMFKKVYGIGMRNAKIANAAVYSLSQMPGNVGLKEIIVLRTATKYNPALVHINRVFNKLAEARNITPEELETLAVPDYGLTALGTYRAQLGEYQAILNLIAVGKTQLLWQKGEKLQKTVPAAIKQTHADDIKSIKDLAKDIQVGSRAHSQRLEQFYLRQQSIPISDWLEQYIHHRLIGFLARRLIWRISTGKQQEDVFYQEGVYLNTEGQPVVLPEQGEVTLWHPSLSSAAEVKYWRDWLIEQQITQPFKQAYREIYLLTDAERNTRDHSLRFANHILKHQQFHALAVQRGWQQTVGGSWDGGQENSAYKSIPAYKVGVSFEAEGLDQYDYTDTGIYACVSTSEVRFYRNHKALLLEKLDPLLFSEVMRDVDLFVGVSSIGNDPNWEARERRSDGPNYWQNSSFGQLSEMAKTRKAVLEALIPKLKIAQQVHLEERFLVVKGKVRTYKIHLGSSNILMEPNDSYLCIVEVRAKETNVMLPFEGDSILSLILSKAMLLANDHRIKDTTILSQINTQ